VNEHVFSAFIALDEAETLVRIEEFDCAFAFANDLRRHSAALSATAAIAAAKAAATISAAEAAPVAATKAAPVPVAKAAARGASEPVVTAEAILISHEGIETFFSEAFPLVASPSATTSIKTHLPNNTFASPHASAPGDADDSRQATGQATSCKCTALSSAPCLIYDSRANSERNYGTLKSPGDLAGPGQRAAAVRFPASPRADRLPCARQLGISLRPTARLAA